jgi:hypothetical protein
MGNLDPLNAGYTDKQYTKAMITAYRLGMAKSHFVVVDYRHFAALLAAGAVVNINGEWTKKSTGKRLWLAADNAKLVANHGKK